MRARSICRYACDERDERVTPLPLMLPPFSPLLTRLFADDLRLLYAIACLPLRTGAVTLPAYWRLRLRRATLYAALRYDMIRWLPPQLPISPLTMRLRRCQRRYADDAADFDTRCCYALPLVFAITRAARVSVQSDKGASELLLLVR